MKIDTDPITSQIAGPSGNMCLVAPPAGGPAVLVLHAWWGLTPFFQRVCDRLAANGFVALAPDLYSGRTAGTIDEAKALLDQRDFGGMQAAAIAATRLLREHPLNARGPIGVIGFSMGAAWAALLASQLAPEAIRAVVLFYGGGEGSDFSQCTADVIGHFAPGDEWEPDEGVRQTEADLRAAGREVTFYTYPGAGHWFVEEDKPEHYNRAAAELAWERTLQFLHARLGY
jgi:carboxymethylenebutenolidase